MFEVHIINKIPITICLQHHSRVRIRFSNFPIACGRNSTVERIPGLGNISHTIELEIHIGECCQPFPFLFHSLSELMLHQHSPLKRNALHYNRQCHGMRRQEAPFRTNPCQNRRPSLPCPKLLGCFPGSSHWICKSKFDHSLQCKCCQSS